MRSQCPPATSQSPRFASQRGQSTVEFIGTLPVMVLAAAICLQAFLLGLTAVYAQAGATSLSRSSRHGDNLTTAALPIPRAWRDDARISTRARGSTITLRAPAVLPGLSTLLPAVSAPFADETASGPT